MQWVTLAEKMLEIYLSAEKILYVIIVVVGVPVNLVAIVILSRGNCGLSACTSHYLVAMAVADLLVIIIEVILFQINYLYSPWAFLDITPVCRVVNALTFTSRNCSVWFTVTFTVDRFIAICHQKLQPKYCTESTAAAVLATTSILLCLKNAPFYFTFEPAKVVGNVTWGCSVKDSYYIEPGWVAFDWFNRVLTPLIPFALILLLNALTVRHILVASRVRKGLRGQSEGKKLRDPEMENRRRSVVLLLTVSFSFILLWLTIVVEFAYYQITGNAAVRSDSETIFHFVGYLLSNVSCCTNTFIYGVTQSKFREQVTNALKYPVSCVLQAIVTLCPKRTPSVPLKDHGPKQFRLP